MGSYKCKISNQIKYPCFTKNERYYYLTLSPYFTIRFLSDDISCFLAEYEELVFTEEETEITKEQFIEANKDLLQKTGLINLFEEPFKWKENQIYYDNIKSELESEIYELKSLLKRYL